MSLLDWFRSSGAIEPEPEPDSDGPVNRGVRASSLLQDTLIREALKAFEREAVDRFRVATDDYGMRRAQAEIRAVEALARYLRGVMEKGRSVSAEAERERKRVEMVGLRRAG